MTTFEVTVTAAWLGPHGRHSLAAVNIFVRAEGKFESCACGDPVQMPAISAQAAQLLQYVALVHTSRCSTSLDTEANDLYCKHVSTLHIW